MTPGGNPIDELGPAAVFDSGRDVWIVTDRELTEEAFESPSLGVRPANQPVPQSFIGSRVGMIFANMARWNDGERHEIRRSIVDSLIGSFDLASVFANARRASGNVCQSAADMHEWIVGVSPYTLGLTIGVDENRLPHLTADVQAFTRAIAPDASGDQITAGVAAAERLWESISPIGTTDIVTANLIGLLFQGYDSLSGLLGNALIYMQIHPDVTDVRTVIRHVMHESPSIRNTRRFAAAETRLGNVTFSAGSTLLLDLEAAVGGPSLAFGAGPHRCPGQVVSFTIAAAALEVGPRLTDIPESGYRYFPYANARVPDFRGVPIGGPSS